MKKLLTLFAALIVITVSVLARPLSESEAREIAMKKFAELGKNMANTKIRKVKTKAPEDSQPVYIYNYNGGGFVIVAGDDAVQNIVIGFSADGEFLPEYCAPAAKEWLEDIENMIRAIQVGELEAPKCSSDGTHYPAVGPLITTKWNQKEPYNKYCPFIGEEQCVTGCVATALAQVMNYWQYPINRNVDIPSYEWNGETLSINNLAGENAVNMFDWENMSDLYNDQSTDIQKDAVAQLMYDCGVALKMSYGVASDKGSGAFTRDCWNVLVNYYGYDKGARYMLADYMPRNEWTAKVKAELDSQRPVLYNGRTSKGGHAFVCDGYCDEGLFHINWGWGGSCDGYFELDVLNPREQGIGGSVGGYSYNQGAFFGVQKPIGDEKQEQGWFFGIEQVDVQPSEDRNNFSLIIETWNLGGGDFAGNLSMRFVNIESNEVKTVLFKQVNAQKPLGSLWGWKNEELTNIDCSKYADGVYDITMLVEDNVRHREIAYHNISNVAPRFLIKGGKIYTMQELTELYKDEELISGQAAWVLNGNKAGANPIWRQNLSGDNVDTEPVLDSTHGIVVRATTVGLNSICRPTSGTMGGNVQVYDFVAIYGDEVWGVPVDGELEAGHPYLFVVNQQNASENIAYVNFFPGNKTTKEAQNINGLKGVLDENGTRVYGEDNNEATPLSIVFTATTLKYANASGNIVGYGKCYIDAMEALKDANEKPALARSIGRIDDDSFRSTAISNVISEVQSNAYNIQGMRVDENYKGIVIIDGKKVLWK